jgi:2',3'-cyclic-nucleotide 2'-phosphodiesterase (5'-nucleotidase family)
MRKNIFLLIAILLALVLVSCSSTLTTVEPIEKQYTEIVPKEKPVVETIKEDQLKLKIIVTSDVEGSIFLDDFTNNRETEFSQLSVASYVEQQRKEDQEVILLDGGNVLQGNALLYYYNYENQEKQHIVSQVMNTMQYDVASISKKDFELPEEIYLRVASQFDFPLTVANLFYKENNEAIFFSLKLCLSCNPSADQKRRFICSSKYTTLPSITRKDS